MAKDTSIKLTKSSNIGRPKIWTDDRLIALTLDCINWLKANPEAISKSQYVAQAGFNPEKICPSATVNPAFHENLKKINAIIEARLLEKAAQAKNPVFWMFLLKCKHGYIEEEKAQAKAQTVVHHHIPRADMAKLGDSDLQEQIRKLTSG